MKLEIMKVLVASTGHITADDNAMLQTFSGPEDGENLPSDSIRAAEDGYGFFVWAGDADEPELAESYYKELLRTGISKDFVNILRLAAENKCTYVRLDMDGPAYSELPKHEW